VGCAWKILVFVICNIKICNGREKENRVKEIVNDVANEPNADYRDYHVADEICYAMFIRLFVIMVFILFVDAHGYNQMVSVGFLFDDVHASDEINQFLCNFTILKKIE
jgi:hypothetical protein